MKKTLSLIFCTLFCVFNANALTIKEFRAEHKKNQQQFFANLDYCSNIGAKEIFNLGTKNLSLLEQQTTEIKDKFNNFKQKKEECFNATANFLDSIIADNFIAMQSAENTVAIQMQNKIDQDFIEVVKLRKQINLELIDNILNDLENSLKNTSKENYINSFITESDITKQLISQDLTIVYDAMQSQLNLDETLLDITANKTVIDIANISVRSAFLNLSRALILFEDINKEPNPYNIAKIKTFLDTSYNKMQELKAFSNNLEELDSKKDINQILNSLSIITVDVEVVLKDLNEDNFADNYLNWASLLYQQTSSVLEQVQKVLDSIYLANIMQDDKAEEKNNKTTKKAEPTKSSANNKNN